MCFLTHGVPHMHKGDVYLTGELARALPKLGLCRYLCRCSVDDGDLERTDIPAARALFCHNENTFAGQGFICG